MSGSPPTTGSAPDFCEAADPESKGMVENLVGYAKADLMIPQQPFTDLVAANTAAVVWCAEVNAARHSEIAAVPADRLETERPLLRPLPSLRPDLGSRPTTRKVDKLSCIRFGSARYSVPCRLIGHTVTITTTATMITVVEPVTGEVLAEHALVGPGQTSICDDHYDRPRPDRPRRAPRPRTQVEKDFCALGPVAEAFLVGAAAAGVSKLATELADIVTLKAAHGEAALLAALGRAVTYRRWRAADIRSILAAGGHAPTARPAGEPLGQVLTLPLVPTRSLQDYKITITGEAGQ
jgi:Mu transposase-like protein